MKTIVSIIATSIVLLFSANSLATESTDQLQTSQIKEGSALTEEQKHQKRQLFLQQQKQIRDERNKVLRAQHAEKFPVK